MASVWPWIDLFPKNAWQAILEKNCILQTKHGYIYYMCMCLPTTFPFKLLLQFFICRVCAFFRLVVVLRRSSSKSNPIQSKATKRKCFLQFKACVTWVVYICMPYLNFTIMARCCWVLEVVSLPLLVSVRMAERKSESDGVGLDG